MLPFKRSSSNTFDRWYFTIDRPIFYTALMLMVIGLLLDLTVSPYVSIRLGAPPLHFFYHQVAFQMVGFMVILWSSGLSRAKVKQLAHLIFGVGIITIMAILALNYQVKGAKRWIHAFGFSIQPSEFVKVAFPVVIASIWTHFKENPKRRNLILAGVYGLCAGLIILQPDLGMVILLSITFVALMFLLGMRVSWVLVIAILGVILLAVAYFSFNHVRCRIDSFFTTTHHSYQLVKATSALQHGGIFGTGAGNGYFKQYLPDAHTDFIFSVAVEEYGVVFAILLIGLYLFIFFKALKWVSWARYGSFTYISIAGLCIVFITQTFIHIASNIGVIPAKGVTMPFISYGGTSIISTSLLIGILLALGRKRY